MVVLFDPHFHSFPKAKIGWNMDGFQKRLHPWAHKIYEKQDHNTCNHVVKEHTQEKYMYEHKVLIYFCGVHEHVQTPCIRRFVQSRDSGKDSRKTLIGILKFKTLEDIPFISWEAVRMASTQKIFFTPGHQWLSYF